MHLVVCRLWGLDLVDGRHATTGMNSPKRDEFCRLWTGTDFCCQKSFDVQQQEPASESGPQIQKCSSLFGFGNVKDAVAGSYRREPDGARPRSTWRNSSKAQEVRPKRARAFDTPNELHLLIQKLGKTNHRSGQETMLLWSRVGDAFCVHVRVRIDGANFVDTLIVAPGMQSLNCHEQRRRNFLKSAVVDSVVSEPRTTTRCEQTR